MAVMLGKDCSVSVNGALTSVRSVSFTATVRTIDINEFGSRCATVYPTGYDMTAQIEFNDASDMGSVMGYIENGTEVTVSGGAGGWSFPAVIVGFSESDPLDSCVSFTVEAKMTKSGLRING